eukprot:TRINITY_DN1368_c0_g1_i2.p1 TRINITY_DN1368_c0_g1~~TRINITY_DN1368_c0_g1_i2.p1  ORF type:complete len:186 (-),score=73.57 TRINITY_DN1368_c0_g1_i2:38-595(-)
MAMSSSFLFFSFFFSFFLFFLSYSFPQHFSRELVVFTQKEERADKKKVNKAEIASQLENKIKLELMNRLKKGTYSEFGKEYALLLEGQNQPQEKQIEEEKEVEQEVIPDVEYVGAGFDSTDESESEYSSFSEDEEEESDEQAKKKQKKETSAKPKKGKDSKKKTRRPHVEIEYEEETEPSLAQRQ